MYEFQAWNKVSRNIRNKKKIVDTQTKLKKFQLISNTHSTIIVQISWKKIKYQQINIFPSI